MGRTITQRLKGWVRAVAGWLRMKEAGSPVGARDVTRLRHDFRLRYHHFKLLLAANDQALKIMAEMEEMLRGSRPFGMTFVRSRCARLAAAVFQIIRHLDALAPGRYTPLYERFRAIRAQISPVVEQTVEKKQGPLVLFLDHVDKGAADVVGPKMANLGELSKRLGLSTPKGFVITVHGTSHFFNHHDLLVEVERRMQATQTDRRDEFFALSAQIQQLIIQSPVPADLQEAISIQVEEMTKERGDVVRFAVRSSCVAEDQPGMSFAGQFRSELNVSADYVCQAFKEVVASKYTPTAMSYRLHHGLRDEDVAMAVGCLEMVEARTGGVIYTRNPVQIREDVLIINATWGLPKSVVDGSVRPDMFKVSRREPYSVLDASIARKAFKYACHIQEGLRRRHVSNEIAEQPSITIEQIRKLARLALQIEAHYGVAQDIEWVIDTTGRIVILQARPLEVMNKQAELSAEVATKPSDFDGSVLIEGGVTASPGAASGRVFRVGRDADLLRCPEGAVLVVQQALPRWATLLERVAAVVSERGGIAGHLASVAREFDVPALFGIPQAWAILESGRWVTVDADQRCIYDGKVDLPKAQTTSQTGLMEGSPVHAALKEVSRFIIPLHLLDPNAPEFAPNSCQTLHDITRFCHEKAVQEMFRFGSEQDFPERSAKQLRCQVPMQFWIIDLDDGFTVDILEPYVKLNQIASIPMLALWEGMTAVPWEGPPPVDSRGFMSVLMEAAANPALDPAVASPYAIRNYFMISRHFCSLQSRFGFHFATVEALVSDRMSENYLSFQFKGGAADLRRRILRAHFVADLLERFDFRCDVREDAVFARLEDRPQDEMEDRLRVLGYLVIHTRQLDMVMNNETSVAHYRNKMLSEIARIRSSTTNCTPKSEVGS